MQLSGTKQLAFLILNLKNYYYTLVNKMYAYENISVLQEEVWSMYLVDMRAVGYSFTIVTIAKSVEIL